MAFLVLVIDATSGESIAQLNAKIQDATNPNEALNNVTNYLDGIKSGAKNASVQVTIRDTDPSVATSGSGSTQNTYNKS